jgi:hypothetical protein
MNKLSVMLLLAFAAQRRACHPGCGAVPAPSSPRADAIARLAETETLLNRKTAELIEKHVDETNRKLDLEMDRRISGKLKLTLLD